MHVDVFVEGILVFEGIEDKQGIFGETRRVSSEKRGERGDNSIHLFSSSEENTSRYTYIQKREQSI